MTKTGQETAINCWESRKTPTKNAL